MANILQINTTDESCFLCNKDFTTGGKSFLIFNERVQNDGTFDCPLSHLLSAALDLELEESSAHSKLLCSNCNLIVLTFEKLERELFAIRTRIKNDYDRTRKHLEMLHNNKAEDVKESLNDESSMTVEFIETTDEEILGFGTDSKSVLPAVYMADTEANTDAVVTVFNDNENEEVYEDTDDTNASLQNVAEEQYEDIEVKFEPDIYILKEASNENKAVNETVIELKQIASSDAHKATQSDSLVPTNTTAPFTCQFCSETFKNEQLLGKHFAEQHAESMTAFNYECELCNLNFESYQMLLQHISTHDSEDSYICELCLKCFASKYSLQIHKKTHDERVRQFKCDQCDKHFLTQRTLQQHKKTHTSIRAFKCKICQKSFATQHNLDAHGITHSGLRQYHCQTCGKSFARKAEMNDHVRIHAGIRPFKCDFCDMAFTQRSNLTAHKKSTHFNEKHHKCDLCDRSFKRRRLLEYHRNAAHTGERPYKCDKCSSSFVYKEHYKKHLLIHTGEKPYACEVCNKRFNSRDNRNAHRFVHSDKKPYECVECGAGFMRKPLLLAHMKQVRHINDTIIMNQPQVNCGVLQTTTIMVSSTEEAVDEPREIIIDHPDDFSESNEASEATAVSRAATNTECIQNEKDENTIKHKCDICKRTFKRRGSLEYHKNAAHTDTNHVIKHTEKQQFACEVCEKSFSSRESRNAHRFVHSDKKPYECVECGAGFMRKPLLLTHMKRAQHINDTFIINRPEVIDGVLQTTTVDELKEITIDRLDGSSQSHKASEVTAASSTVTNTDCVQNEKGENIEILKSMVKTNDFVVSWQDIVEEEEEV